MKVLVHNPYEFPEVSGKGFAVGSSKEAFLAVSAQVTERYLKLNIFGSFMFGSFIFHQVHYYY